MNLANMFKQMMHRQLSDTRYLFQDAPPIKTDTAYGIYINVPFCPTHCSYCPFYTEMVHNYKDRLDEYTQAVIKEINNSQLHQNPDWVYIGGGTPNTLSIAQLSNILSALRKKVSFDICGIELLPSLLDEKYISGLSDIGITKLSMGVQTFSEDVIHKTGRKYILQNQTEKIVKQAQASGIWVSLDMMAGLDNQSAEQFQQDIQEIIRIGPDQLAVYPIVQIKGVDYGMSYSMPSIEQYRLIESAQESMLQAGYHRNTAWIFSRGNEEVYDSSGNEMGMEYIGFGAGAYSVIGKWKKNNPPLKTYLHGMANNHPMTFLSERKKSNDNMRRLSKMIYHLQLENDQDLGFMPAMIIQWLKLGGYVKHNQLTAKGRLLSHEMSKAAMEALPLPIQDPTSVLNYHEYEAYTREFSK